MFFIAAFRNCYKNCKALVKSKTCKRILSSDVNIYTVKINGLKLTDVSIYKPQNTNTKKPLS